MHANDVATRAGVSSTDVWRAVRIPVPVVLQMADAVEFSEPEEAHLRCT